MFEIGFPELMLIAIVGLLVIGPERLPEALRTLGLWLGRMRRSFTAVKAEIEKEIGMDEVKRQLHNEAIMDEMRRIEQEVKQTTDSARSSLNDGIDAASATGVESPDVAAAPRIDPNTHTDITDTIAAQDSINPPRPEATDQQSDESPEDLPANPVDEPAQDDDRTHADAADDRSHADAATPAAESDDEAQERVKNG